MDALSELLKGKKRELSSLKSRLKKLKNEKAKVEAIVKLERQISNLEAYLNRFKKSNIQPVRFKDIVINYKLYERFMKKLKGFQITHELQSDRLVVHYRKGSTKGNLELLDITHHFPTGSVFEEGDYDAFL